MSPLSRISVDPTICHGKPCIKGHRVPVALILECLADGESIEELLSEYPGLQRDDILACVAYAAELARGSLLEVPTGASQ
jgi:uncharacterized protein (DUF433 family)